MSEEYEALGQALHAVVTRSHQSYCLIRFTPAGRAEKPTWKVNVRQADGEWTVSSRDLASALNRALEKLA